MRIARGLVLGVLTLCLLVGCSEVESSSVGNAPSGNSSSGVEVETGSNSGEEIAEKTPPSPDTSQDFVSLEGRELIEHEVEGLLYSHYEQIGSGDLERAYENFGPSYRAATSQEAWVSEQASYGIESATVHEAYLQETQENVAVATVEVSFADDSGAPYFVIDWVAASYDEEGNLAEGGVWKLEEVTNYQEGTCGIEGCVLDEERTEPSAEVVEESVSEEEVGEEEFSNEGIRLHGSTNACDSISSELIEGLICDEYPTYFGDREQLFSHVSVSANAREPLSEGNGNLAQEIADTIQQDTELDLVVVRIGYPWSVESDPTTEEASAYSSDEVRKLYEKDKERRSVN